MTKTVLITGASTGIGLATAQHLAESGYHVCATARDPSKAQELQELSKRVGNLFILPLDVNNKASIQEAVKTMVRRLGRIDVLINNAGFGIYGPTETLTDGEIEAVFKTNVFATIWVIRAVLPFMIAQKEGRIINLSSIAGVVPSTNMPVYSAAKFAIESLSTTFNTHLAAFNIRTIVIQPGPVLTCFEPKTEYGTHFEQDSNPYRDRLPLMREKWKEMMDKGHSPLIVAQVIKEAIEDPNPRLRYQTSEEMEEKMKKHYKEMADTLHVPLIAKM